MKSTMKFLAAAAVTAVTAGGVAYASPRAAEASGADYLAAAENLDGVHIGAYYRYTSREIGGGYDTLSQDRLAFVLGCDLFRWLSIYGVVGTADAQLERHNFGDHGFASLYGGGAWINILDHDLLSNLSCETKLRLTATAQYTASSPEINGTKCDCSDFYGAVTLGIVNELMGNKAIWPDAIGLFLGPVWDVFDCDEYKTEGDDVGFAVGLDLYVTRRVGISLSYETYGGGDEAVNASLNCRF